MHIYIYIYDQDYCDERPRKQARTSWTEMPEVGGEVAQCLCTMVSFTHDYLMVCRGAEVGAVVGSGILGSQRKSQGGRGPPVSCTSSDEGASGAVTCYYGRDVARAPPGTNPLARPV